ncbi:unnamed protein product [Nesidiocoris tenuis]|uniref:Uncharacterized protein n=1 Tax=Nesidiocoris tenuis TaxID=355587 RepID=A0A6H5FZ27_9HEMI|nr:unnamed protein product [Nesidiocoris tenuis]
MLKLFSYPNLSLEMLQLFSYPNLSPMGGMSGVISPTNLSLFSTPITIGSPRTSSRGALPRWTPPGPAAPPPPPPGPGPPFITLEEDYMMTPLISSSNHETAALIDDGLKQITTRGKSRSLPEQTAELGDYSFLKHKPSEGNIFVVLYLQQKGFDYWKV